jgi:hypothetical protein
LSSSKPEPEVTPVLGSSGKPVRRRGRWTYVSHQWNGPVWRLDGTALDLEHDPGCHSVCNGGDRCNGAWVLYEDGRYKEPVGEYLDGAMHWVEQQHDRAAARTPRRTPSPARGPRSARTAPGARAGRARL